MPTEIHNTHQQWIDQETKEMFFAQFLNQTEFLILKPGVGTTIKHFNGVYMNSLKEPDFLLRFDSQPLPSLTIESGWTESLPRLHADMRLWLVGGAPEVQVVIVLRWSKIAGTPTQKAKGIFEVWQRDAANLPFIRQQGTIFPAPTAGPPETIPVTRADLFGPAHVQTGKNGGDLWNMRVDILRFWARLAIQNMGLVPA
ncbi:hypothetical protein PISL3812_02396 [Talaromyces islandicus]|uniref:Uncharacterized protein n=1 Tax=Talaromyces islandicus TaxID=28573 RepID=A0A0U1LPT6_TALIS|nr:hypothetical protein PISL3812_02396 [Talaromyces islandicus]